MTDIKLRKICDVSPALAFETVKNFNAYPEFLPWCAGARLKSSETDAKGREVFIADLIIAYKGFSESFTTEVTCDPTIKKIDIKYLKGPFKKLSSYWRFDDVKGDESKSEIEFMINFEFKSMIFSKIVSVFFEEAMRKMISAFEKRFVEIQL
ncbi:MAG: type II toxin-antitoxin system RatA family toxin [Pseudomonadota bacterium]